MIKKSNFDFQFFVQKFLRIFNIFCYFFLKKSLIVKHLLNELKYCQWIFQTNTWLARARVFSLNHSDIDMVANEYLIYNYNKYFTCDRFFIIIWSFRYVIAKYCQLIFWKNTWLAWTKVFSDEISDKDMNANKYLICDKYFICHRFFIGDIIYWRTCSIEHLLFELVPSYFYI